MIGTTLSHFRITAKLGEGGMGEVYRAEDTKLGREVAIKVLPEAFVSDPDRLARFEREARVLASLSHPNIAGIYEVGEAEVPLEDRADDGEAGPRPRAQRPVPDGMADEGDGEAAPRPRPETAVPTSDPGSVAKTTIVHYLVMELAAGTTLSQRLERGAVPQADALAIAVQIARGLEAAHEKGVVHRDLKPANVMIDDKGGVKILDFGLAKALEPEPGSDAAAGLAHSPTLTYQATVAGTLMGTAAYMSPEQARGEPADRRADVWAFGVVLWEMLTGIRLFEGRTVSDTLAGILRDEIDPEALPAACPRALRRLMGRCLEREPDRRLHDVADARIVIEDVIEGRDDETPPETSLPGVTRRRPSETAAWILAALFLVVALGAGWVALTRGGQKARPPSVHAHILPPAGTDFDFGDKHVGSLALSPDGSRLVVSAVSREDRRRVLYLRPLDSTTATPLPGTEGATFPFWSPDGRFVAFFAGGKLKKVDAGGGAPLTICDATDGRGGTWSQDGVIVFAPATQGPLHRVSSAGGSSSPVTALDPSRQETTHRHPSFLPDGRRFLYSGVGYLGELSVNQTVWLESLDSTERTPILESKSEAILSAGHLLYVQDGFLMAQPFDTDRGTLSGDPLPIAETVLANSSNAGAAFTASDDGTLVYYRKDVSDLQLTLLDRDGRALGTIGAPGSFGSVRISPAGDRLAATLAEEPGGATDIWIYELESGNRTRLTFDPGVDANPIWSPDGSRIAYSAFGEDGTTDIFVQDALGGGQRELLLGGPTMDDPWDWSPDGSYLLVNRTAGADLDIWVLPLDGGEPFPLVEGDAMDGWGHFSPDGRWVAYLSNESGEWQLYATPFPEGEGRWQLTSDSQGGYWIVDWIPSGIYHVTSDSNLAVLEVRVREGSIEAGRRERLMPIGGDVTWSVDQEGTRFVLGLTPGDDEDPPLTLVTNWLAGIR